MTAFSCIFYLKDYEWCHGVKMIKNSVHHVVCIPWSRQNDKIYELDEMRSINSLMAKLSVILQILIHGSQT